MEFIHYTNPRCGWYCAASTNSLNLYPEELVKLAAITKEGKIAIIDSWYGSYGMTVTQQDDKTTITVDRMNVATLGEEEYKTSLTVPSSAAIHIHIISTKAFINCIKLPLRLNDKVAWALGANTRTQKAKTLKELEDYFMRYDKEYEELLKAGRIQLGPCYAPEWVDYGKCHAVSVNDGYGKPRSGRYYIDGYLTRDEAVDILTKALKLNGWHFSYPAKVKYVLDSI
jgi:hypothetical protein